MLTAFSGRLPSRTPLAIVLLVWLVASVYLVVQASRYAINCPFGDDFAFIEQMTGNAPVTWAWLWETHNEHRMVLPKLALVGLGRISGFDFRIAAFASVCLTIAACLVSIITVMRIRGRLSVADALIPLVVCTWGQSDALTWTSPFNLVVSSALLLAWWSAATEASSTRSPAAVACAVLLGAFEALTGGTGVAALAGIVPWFAWFACCRASSLGQRVLAGITAVALVAYGVVYAFAYQRPGGHPAPASLRYTGRYLLHLVAGAFSTVDAIAEIFGIGVLAVVGVVTLWALRFERERTVASISLVAATLAVGGAVAIGRAGFGVLQIAPRYVTLMIPLAVGLLALVSRLDEGPRRAVLTIVATVVILSVPNSDKLGHGTARALRIRLTDAVAQIRAGEPLEAVIVERELYPELEYALPRMRMLERAKGSVFASVPSR